MPAIYRLVLRIVVVLSCSVASDDIWAQTVLMWNAGSANWELRDNWNPMSVPTSSHFVEINNGGTATVNSARSASRLWLARPAGSSGNISIAAGAQLTSGNTIIGDSGTGVGTVTAGTWNTFQMQVGVFGTGTLNIAQGSEVNSSSGYLGLQAGSTGTVNVNGADSKWLLPNLIESVDVGYRGTGYLNIVGGGLVDNDLGTVGTFANSVGEVFIDAGTWSSHWTLRIGAAGSGLLRVLNGGSVTTVSDTHLAVATTGSAQVHVRDTSTMDVGGKLFVGYNGVGVQNATMTIEDQAEVTAASGVTIGELAGANGALLVESMLRSDSTLTVGHSGKAYMEINSGGVVDVTGTALTYIARQAGSNGELKITGAGSKLKHRNTLTIGAAGTGKLSLIGGGTIENVNNSSVDIGDSVGSSGTVDVNTGSTWVNGGDITVADAGFGRLNIGAAGTVQNASAYVGRSANSDGAVQVDAAGSWISTGALNVGYFGTGVLTINQGGNVQSGSATIGQFAGSTGSAVVHTGATWTSSGQLAVGSSGLGTLQVNNGGLVQSTSGRIGSSAAANFATIQGKAPNGTPSKWAMTGSMTIGSLGTGTLNVAGGAQVENTSATMGSGGTANGIANISGEGSLWKSTSSLTVGSSGTATLSITSGGAVQNTSATVGSSNTGVVHVVGADADEVPSSWTSSGTLTVGSSGMGTMNVREKAFVQSAAGRVGDSTGGIGIVNVNDIGTLWRNTGDLNVGSSGTGTINITGGTVENTVGILGRFDGTGTANVGLAALWKNTADLTVGSSGVGRLHVTNGGRVESVNGIVGRNNGTNGIANVHANATWAASGNVTVGGTGTGVGTLDLKDGGYVTVGGNMTINAGGTLQGTGRIDATQVINNGTIKLGTARTEFDGTIPADMDFPLYVTNYLIDGDFTQGPSGKLVASGWNTFHKREAPDLGRHDTGMIVAGTATLSGSLSVEFQPGFVPDIGDRFAIISAAEITGRIANFESAIIPGHVDRFLGLNYRSKTDGDEPVLEVITLAAPRRIHGSANSPNLLLVTHGTRDNANEDEWVDQLAHTMATAPNAGDWEVVTLDWQPYNGGDTDIFANDFQPGGGTFDPLGAGNNAINIGESLVRWYRAQQRSFESVHLFAHSAGTWLADSMADDLFLHGDANNIHLTLFEAFVPPIGIEHLDGTPSEMADHVDFAEHYLHANAFVRFTDGVYDLAVNGDLTQFHPLSGTEPVASHAYPYIWYTGTAGNPLGPAHRGLGIQLSQIYSGVAPNWEAENTAFSAGDLIVLNADDAANVTIGYTPINFGEQTNALTGDVEVSFDSVIMETHSPAIITSLLDVDDPFSAIAFDMEFLSDNPGLLSVYLGSEQIFGFENEFYAAGPGDLMNSGLVWLGEEMPAGPYSLTFRLDPLGAGDASIEISNLQFVTLTEVTSQPDGDFNADGSVDAADYVMWRKLGFSPAQYTAWRANFGAGSNGAGGDANSLVPEPNLPLLVLWAMSAFLFRKPHRELPY